MKVLSQSYDPPFWARNRHFSTMFPSLFRKKIFPANGKTVRLETRDKDFIDLDHYKESNSQVAVISHGLEGYARNAYMLGMARALLSRGMDVICWNFRGCSGELNRTPGFYHAGKASDLDLVVNYAAQHYDSINLVGFSLGGNLTLNYLGGIIGRVHPAIKASAVASVPVDMVDSGFQLHRWYNKIYHNRFLRKLKSKVRAKLNHYPELIDRNLLNSITSLKEFDDMFTAPMGGFQNAIDYWERTSSKTRLAEINVPTLILQASDDPFLGEDNYPPRVAQGKMVRWVVPDYGGHLGFAPKPGNEYFQEKILGDFLQNL